MILYPAIDLKDGACVRLLKGAMDSATIFNDDPAAQAKSFADTGARWIHVVDLNGAFAGKAVNSQSVDAIIKSSELPVQLGGGIRDMASIESWLSRGLSRVILGTVALRNPVLIKEACKLFPDRIAVGIDARHGMVAVEGWADISDITALELALKFEDSGVCTIIYTDIERDGTLTGPNVEATAALAEKLTTPVIASGGVSSLADLSALKKLEHTGITGVISGRAIYDGRIDLKAALDLLEEA